MFKSQLATFKDGTTIRGYVKMNFQEWFATISRVVIILKERSIFIALLILNIQCEAMHPLLC
jgi:hypothetical protein